MRYVALLRGINVGGNTTVAMPQLKACFEAAGCQDVSTYINSGNVLFSDDRPTDELETLIEAALLARFELPLRIVLRDYAAIKQICATVPADWTNDSEQKTDAIFLWDEINNAAILDKVAINPSIEHVRYVGGALVWNIGRHNATRGGSVKLIKTDLYRHMTARNINTVRKLERLMAAFA